MICRILLFNRKYFGARKDVVINDDSMKKLYLSFFASKEKNCDESKNMIKEYFFPVQHPFFISPVRNRITIPLMDAKHFVRITDI